LLATNRAADGEALPAPSDVTMILKSLKAEVGEFDATVMIPLLRDMCRSVRANISLDAGLLEAIDAEAKRRGLTRSSFVANAAREKIVDAQ
jgi:HicB_like antitoxin of bacterial toxin-antitoxin system